ncbi:MAG: hypothetical protein ABWZ25_13455 [Chitinophagaceae bacterium]
MKNLRIHALTFLCIMIATFTSAQKTIELKEPDPNKPKLFAQLPSRIPVEIADLEKLIHSNPETGKTASLDLTGKGSATFAGKVVSTASKYNNSIRSIVIRSTSFNGATFSLSAITKEDGTTEYAGRIISFKHADLYELQLEGKQYFLIKKNFNELVNE